MGPHLSLSPILSPCIRSAAGTSSEHSFSGDSNSKLQKLRSWWSKKNIDGLTASPESSDTDNERVNDYDDFSVFMKARCRLMRTVGQLDNVLTGVQDVHSQRYGPSEVEDTSRDLKLRVQHRGPGLDNKQWEQMLLMNTVDVVHRKVQAIRSLCTSYTARMGQQVHHRLVQDNGCVIETRVEKMDSHNDLDSTKTQVEYKKVAKNPFVRGFAFILALISSAFCFIIGKSTQKTTEEASPSKAQSTPEDLTSRLVKEAFRKEDNKGLEDSATSDNWMLLTITSYPKNGIVQRCVNLETFLGRDRSTTIHAKDITSANVTPPLISSLKKIYLQTIEYCGEVRFCGYIELLLRNINTDLFEAQKGLDGIHDRSFKSSRPYSDRGALLRQALTRGEVKLELKQIHNTSASRQELLTKNVLTKLVLQLEVKVEGIHQRYNSWRRAREMPGRRHQIADKPAVRKAARLETQICFRQTSGGLVVRRICVAKKRSLVERAFGGHTVNGLNVVTSIKT